MGLIYKLGNSIQSLPFPGSVIFTATNSIRLSIIISLLLSIIQWNTNWVANSVSLSAIASLQIVITSLLSLFLILNTFQDRIKQQKFRFLYFFLSGFFIFLTGGYLLFDALSLFSSPIFQFTNGLWVTSLASSFGNILIVQVLSASRVIPFKVKTLQIPFFSIIIFSFLHLASLSLVFSLDWWPIDPIIGLLEALIIGLWGAVTFLDAYWQIVELDKMTNH